MKLSKDILDFVLTVGSFLVALLIGATILSSCSPYHEYYQAVNRSKQRDIIKYIMHESIEPKCDELFGRGTEEAKECIRISTANLLLNIDYHTHKAQPLKKRILHQ